jgi:hypothetical protein
MLHKAPILTVGTQVRGWVLRRDTAVPVLLYGYLQTRQLPGTRCCRAAGMLAPESGWVFHTLILEQFYLVFKVLSFFV